MSGLPDSTGAPFVPMLGSWEFSENRATYRGPFENQARPVGFCLWPTRFRSGTVSVTATFPHHESAARILIGYSAKTQAYYSIGLGGYQGAYMVSDYQPDRGWFPLRVQGDCQQLAPKNVDGTGSGSPFRVHVHLAGQHVALSVNDVRVIETSLPAPLQGDQVGLFAWGKHRIDFTNFEITADKPRVFVVMQFGEPYNSLYQDVIIPVSEKEGFKAVRGDDVFRPGIILQDIWRDIVSSDVIIAEITPANPNVFYELGFAHAMGKQTVLLANRQLDKLPFDVSGYRVIFYDDTIGGKRDVERTLRLHLQNIREGRTMQEAA